VIEVGEEKFGGKSKKLLKFGGVLKEQMTLRPKIRKLVKDTALLTAAALLINPDFSDNTITPVQTSAQYVISESPEYLGVDLIKTKQFVIDEFEKMRQKLVSGEIDENNYMQSSWLAFATEVHHFFKGLDMNKDWDCNEFTKRYNRLVQSYKNLQPLPIDKLIQVKSNLRNIMVAGVLSHGGLPAVFKIIDGEKFTTDERYSMRLASESLGLFTRVAPIDGFVDVIAHGDERDVKMGDIVVSAHDFAKIIKKRITTPDSDPDGNGVHRRTGIRLISCSTGSLGKHNQGIAQSLANHSGDAVLAPKDTLYLHASGKMWVKDHGCSKDGWEFFESQPNFVCQECSVVQKLKTRLTLLTKESVSANETLTKEQLGHVTQIKERLNELVLLIKFANSHPGNYNELLRQNKDEAAVLYQELLSIVPKESVELIFKVRELEIPVETQKTELTNITEINRIR